MKTESPVLSEPSRLANGGAGERQKTVRGWGRAVGTLCNGWTWRMAWRDSRRSRRQLLLYSTAVVLGVAALIAIGSFGQNLARSIDLQAKSLLGADLVLSSREDLTPEAEAFIRGLGGTQAREASFSSMIYFPKRDRARLVQVRALEGDFPFYGAFETTPKTAERAFRDGSGVLVEDSVLKQFGVALGDPAKVGTLVLPVLGTLDKIPGETVALGSIAPRVYMAMANLPKTGLLKPGSIVRHRTYLAFGPDVNVPLLTKQIRKQLDAYHLDADTVEHRKRELGRAMTNLTHFLNLVGFVALLLGGIGIASAMHVHVKQKINTVAVLRSLGGTAAQAFSVYLAQAIALAVMGVGLGAALGLLVQFSLPRILGDFVPVRLTVSLSWVALARGMGIGFLLCLLFALLPLLAVRRISPLGVFRWSYEEHVSSRFDPLLWLCYSLIALGLLGFSLSQARNWQVGLAFAGGLAVAFALLAGVAKLLTWVLKHRLPGSAPFTLRQGLANLYRPNNRTLLLMLALGLGTFLILSLQLVETNLVRQLLPTEEGPRADTVLFDIQSDQREAVKALVEGQHLPVLQQVPIVTMRLASIRGQPVAQVRSGSAGRGIPRWALRREYRSTYRDQLVDSEKLLAGRWHDRVPEGTSPVPVSLEDGIAKTLGVGLGDELGFDVQGVPVKTVVANLREVEWRRLQPNFFVVFPLGVLEDAPAFHVLVTRAGSSANSAKLQRALAQQFPNVSTIDLSLVLQTLDSILNKISYVLRFMAVFTVGTGVLVLISSILAGRYQRLQESVLLRTLGASRGQILQILLVEYLALGTLAALTGIILAVGASWGLAHFLFHIAFTLAIRPLLVAVVAVASLTVLAGLLTGRGVSSQPPLELLRSTALPC